MSVSISLQCVNKMMNKCSNHQRFKTYAYTDKHEYRDIDIRTIKKL